jgi:hypothetical protein
MDQGNRKRTLQGLANLHRKRSPSQSTEIHRNSHGAFGSTTKEHKVNQAEQTSKTSRSHRKNDTNPPEEIATHECFANVIELASPTEKSYSDLTGRFPVHSVEGNLYVLVLYIYGTNAIVIELLKSRNDASQLKAYERILQRIPDNLKPKLHMMDNEASKAIKEFLVKVNHMEYQLVPPHTHRRNAAERAIRTFKNHFIAGFCSTNPDFPLRLWDRLLPQAEITLNLLRASRTQPTKSAYEVMFGPYDYNSHLLMPPGTKIVRSWDPHGKQGWYIGPALEHYRCHRWHINTTNAERISETVEFFHHTDPIPKITAQEATIIAAEALNKALRQQNKPNNMSELLEPTTATLHKLQQFLPQVPSAKAQKPKSPRVPRSPRVQEQPEKAPTTEPIAQRTRNAQNRTLPENFFANAVAHPTTGKLMEYRQLIADPETCETWQKSAANEFGRLA